MPYIQPPDAESYIPPPDAKGYIPPPDALAQLSHPETSVQQRQMMPSHAVAQTQGIAQPAQQGVDEPSIRNAMREYATGLNKPQMGIQQINPDIQAPSGLSLGSIKDVSMWPEELYQGLNRTVIETLPKIARTGITLGKRVGQIPGAGVLGPIVQYLSGSKLGTDTQEAATEIINANESELSDRIKKLKSLGVDPDSVVGQVAGVGGSVQSGITQMALMGENAVKPLTSAQATLEGTDSALQHKDVPVYSAVMRGLASGLTNYGMMSIPGADKLKNALSANGMGAAFDELSSEVPTIYKNVITKYGSKVVRGATIGTAMSEANNLLDKAFIDNKIPWTPDAANLKKNVSEMIAYELTGGVMQGTQDIRKTSSAPPEVAPAPDSPSRDALVQERISLRRSGKNTPEVRSRLVEIGRLLNPETDATIPQASATEGTPQPLPHIELDRSKEPIELADAPELHPSDLLEKTPFPTQPVETAPLVNARTRAADLEGGLLGQSDDLNVLQQRRDQLQADIQSASEQSQTATRTKGPEGTRIAAKTSEGLQSELDRVNEQIGQITGKWDHTKSAWENLKAELAKPGNERGALGDQQNPEIFSKTADLIKAGIKDGYTNASDWLASMRDKLGEDFKDFYARIGGLDGAQKLWGQHGLQTSIDGNEITSFLPGEKNPSDRPSSTIRVEGNGDAFLTGIDRKGEFGLGSALLEHSVRQSVSQGVDENGMLRADANPLAQKMLSKYDGYTADGRQVEVPIASILKGADAAIPTRNGNSEGINATANGKDDAPINNNGLANASAGLNIPQALRDAAEAVKERMGLPKGASDTDLARAVGEKLGNLGKNVKETAVKILNQVKGIGRDLANAIAEHLHKMVSGTREGQLGAVGPDVTPQQAHEERYNKLKDEGKLTEDVTKEAYVRAKIESTAEREKLATEATQNGLSGKEKADYISSKITPIDKMITRNSAPASTHEATELLDVSTKSKDIETRNRASLKLKEGMDNGVFPDVASSLTPQHGVVDPATWFRALDAEYTGHGIFNADGSKTMIPPMINYSVGDAVLAARRDLNLAENLWSRVGSPSHTLTGTLSLSVDGAAGDRTIGAMDPKNNHMTDIMLGQASAFANSGAISQHLVDSADGLGIKFNSEKLQKELLPSRKIVVGAQAEYDRASHDYEVAKSPGTERALAEAKANLQQASEIMDHHLREVAEDPEHGAARAVLDAWHSRGGKESPKWLTDLMSPEEKEMSTILQRQMGEIKRTLQGAGVDVRDDFGVPVLIQRGLDKRTISKVRDSNMVKGELSLDPDSIRFAHRSENSIMTLPDLQGIIEEYIPKASWLASKKVIASKWNTVAAEIRASKPRLADFITRDMANYTNGDSAQIKVLNTMQAAFSNYLVGLRVGTAVKHGAKFFLEVPNMDLRANVGGFAEWRDALRQDPQLSDVMDRIVKTAKGPRYNQNIDIGSGETPMDTANTLGKKVGNLTHQPMQGVEGLLRGTTMKYDLLGAYKKGLSPEQAVADMAYRRMLVNFESLDKPVIMRSSFGRSAFFLQQTIWKLMELNARAATDSVRGAVRTVGTSFSGERMSPEENQRYMQAVKHMMALGGVAALGKATNTDIFKWVTEVPGILDATVFGPAEALLKSMYGLGKTGKWEWDHNAGEELAFGIPSLMPPVAVVTEASKAYGFGSKAFFKALRPPTYKDYFGNPTPSMRKKYGDSYWEMKLRMITALTKSDESQKIEEHFKKRDEKRMHSNQKKMETQ